MAINKKNILSKFCILLIAIYWVYSFTYNRRWEKNPIVWDVVSYYGYLPAVFIYQDITLEFAEKNPDFFAFKYWPEHAPNGGRVIKTTMGLSYLYSPFFFLGHLYAKITGAPQDGFSLPYQVILQIGSLFYLVLGLFFLLSLLSKYFPDKAISLTILSLYFGTNLLYYSIASGLMSHSFIFSIGCIFVWLVERWHCNPNYKTSVLLGFTAGLLTVIRPTMVLIILFPLFFNVFNYSSLKEKLFFLKNNYRALIIVLITFIIPGIPQLLYWKYITGNWFFFSYTGEQFFWDNPHVLAGLFGYRNGWLLYTPIMLFAIAGIFFMRKQLKATQFSIIIILSSFIYVIHSWWCWWYGGFGLRAYIDIYCLLALPMAAFYNFFLTRGIITTILLLIMSGFLIYFNMFQEWQMENGRLHFDSMNRRTYTMGFLKTEISGEWWLSLDIPNNRLALKGLPEYYTSDHYIHHIRNIVDFEDVFSKSATDTTKAYSGKYSYILYGDSVSSPPLILTDIRPAEILVKEVFATVQVYIDGDEPVQKNECCLVVKFANDSGIYYTKNIDLLACSPKIYKWNKHITKIELEKLKKDGDKIEVCVESRKSKNKLLIDDLSIESVYEKE